MSAGKFPPENGTTFSGIPFIPEIFQWNEPNSHVPFTSPVEFPEFFGKWRLLYMYVTCDKNLTYNHSELQFSEVVC